MKFGYKFIIFFILFTLISKLLEPLFITLFLFLIAPIVNLIGGTIFSHQISINGNFLLIVEECTGTIIYSMFLAFALAYKIKKELITKLLIGLGFLLLLNYIRVIALILIAAVNIEAFKFAHNFLWPASFFIFTLIGVIYYKYEADKI